MLRIPTTAVMAAMALFAASGVAASPKPPVADNSVHPETGNAAFFSETRDWIGEGRGLRRESLALANVFFRSGRSLAAARPPIAAPGKPEQQPRSAIGWVDASRVLERLKQSWGWGEPAHPLRKLRERFQAELAAFTRTRYLTEAERAELERLTAIGDFRLDASERQLFSEFQGKSDAMDLEARALAEIASPTTPQQQRLEELTNLRKNAIARLQDETQRRSELLQKRESVLLDAMKREMQEYIRQIAERRHLIAVLQQRAVLHGGIDLTEEVLQELVASGK